MSGEIPRQMPAKLEDNVITTPDGEYPVEFVEDEKLEGAPDILIAIYKTLAEYNCDFAAIFIPHGKATPFQVVNEEKTVEYPTGGDIAIVIQHPNGTIEVQACYESDPETYAARGEYNVGDIICCIAIGTKGSRSIEQSTPPYQPGMFTILNEADQRLSADFVAVVRRLQKYKQKKKSMGPVSMVTQAR